MKKEIAERYGIRKRWWTMLIERSAKVNRLHAHISPGEYSWIGASSGVRGLNLIGICINNATIFTRKGAVRTA